MNRHKQSVRSREMIHRCFKKKKLFWDNLCLNLLNCNLYKVLEFLRVSKGHRSGRQPFGFGWMVHYNDFDPVSFRTVLTLHKDVLYRSNSQHIGGWHDLPAEQQRDEQRTQSLKRHKIYSVGRNFCSKYMQTLLDSVRVTDPMLEKHAVKVPLWWIKQYKVSSRVSYKL